MKARVLIVDDDAAVRESVARVLGASGYEVAAASDGQEAVLRFEPDQVDLVLLDLNLPDESGWDVFERLTTRYPFVPIIIITGLSDQYPTALAAGASALMEKPIEVPVLLKTMDELMAEPKEARLRRMCGHQQDTRQLRPPSPGAPAQSHPHAIRTRRGRRPHRKSRWTGE